MCESSSTLPPISDHYIDISTEQQVNLEAQ